ncbi:MAG: isoprenylcysteine carboxylmethyltransferase family protein [Eubacteriaceae bacterium]|nr:isoprenylcysteine carboxylmethyltransferase family protein [Eubacteriaceae bacterium]
MMDITFNFVITGILSLSITVLLLAIVADFIFYSRDEAVKKSQKSVVATGTMFLFFLVYYTVIRLRLGEIKLADDFLNKALSALGAAMAVSGTVMNILGRLKLKDNWANHIKIYNSHELVQTGVYRIVRHPLYSSIILMLLGGVLVYKNYLSLLLTVLIFIPFMVYRASQEEALLSKEFLGYEAYKRKTGMFFPKIKRRK